MKILLLIFMTVLLFGCESAKKATAYDSSNYDPAETPMRHGWTVFTGPKRTIVGVSDENSINNGRRLFKTHCVGCHGQDAKGNGPLAKVFKIKPADLTALARVAPNYHLVIQVSEGTGDMPKWKSLLTNKELWDLSNFVQTLSR